jgi:predicted RNA-binding protein with TRAM domain
VKSLDVGNQGDGIAADRSFVERFTPGTDVVRGDEREPSEEGSP